MVLATTRIQEKDRGVAFSAPFQSNKPDGTWRWAGGLELPNATPKLTQKCLATFSRETSSRNALLSPPEVLERGGEKGATHCLFPAGIQREGGRLGLRQRERERGELLSSGASRPNSTEWR